MTIKKAVITAAGPDQKHLPLQTIVTASGETKTAISFQLDEVIASGIEETAIVIAPGEEDSFRNAAAPHTEKVTFITQPEPLGYGHAVHCAADFVGDEPFLLLVGDHLHHSTTSQSCIEQLLTVAESEECSVSAVKPTHESLLPYFGTVGGTRIPGKEHLQDIRRIVEKPTPTLAEQELIVPGLRAGYYHCFFGMHVLSPGLMPHLDKLVSEKEDSIPLTPALDQLAQSEKYLSLEIEGQRFNIGEPYGLLRAQLAMGLSGSQRDDVMQMIIELLATNR